MLALPFWRMLRLSPPCWHGAGPQATPTAPASEYINAGDAAILLKVSKKTTVSRCREGQGKKLGGLRYMRGSFATDLDCPSSTTFCGSIGGPKAGVDRGREAFL